MTHLWDRLLDAAQRLTPVQSEFRVVFENPLNPDAPAAILVPDPNWLAAALAGGILPPISSYLDDLDRMTAYCACNPPESFSWDKVGGASHPYAEPIGPMTEPEAIEYLIMKDLPRVVWDDALSNRPRFKIVRAEAIPTNRAFRNAWRLAA